MKFRFLLMKATSISIAASMALTCTVFAAPQGMNLGNPNMGVMQVQGGQNFGVQNNNQFGNMQQNNFNDDNIKQLQKLAQMLGVDYSGLTATELMAAIKEKLDSKQANQGGVPNNSQMIVPGNQGFQNNQMGFFQNQLNYQIIKEVVEIMDIDTDNMTMDEIVDEIIDELDNLSDDELEEVADVLGIDIDDMDNNEIVDAIEDELDNLDTSKLYDLLDKAAELLDIDTDDMTDSEIISEIIDQLDDLSIDKLLGLSKMLGVDISELSSDDLFDELEDALNDLE